MRVGSKASAAKKDSATVDSAAPAEAEATGKPGKPNKADKPGKTNKRGERSPVPKTSGPKAPKAPKAKKKGVPDASVTLDELITPAGPSAHALEGPASGEPEAVLEPGPAEEAESESGEEAQAVAAAPQELPGGEDSTEVGGFEVAASGAAAALPMPRAGLWEWLLGRLSWRRVAGYGALALVLVAVLSWSVLFALAEHFVLVSPRAPSLVADVHPVLGASWPVRGARLKDATVLLDGKDISGEVRRTASGFTYTPRRALAQGRHTVAAVLTYDFVLERKIPAGWVFTVDTVPPDVQLKGFDEMVAARRPWITGIAGRTEPGTKLSVQLEGEAIEAPEVGSNGVFTLNLYAISRRGKMVIDAVDRAGNQSRRVLPVVVDASAPVLKGISPGPGGTTFATKPRMKVELREPDSYIAKIELTIDGRPLDVKLTSRTSRLLFGSDLLSDGKHKASLVVADAAGNGWSKKWAFSVDSTKMKISLSQCRLFLFKHGKLFRTYPVAVGQAGFPTPQGHWKIVNKRYMPTWTNPHVPWSASMPEFIGPGPGNPLGTRALDLSAPGVRIHGTPSSWSIGSHASHGCIRMYMSDVEALFDLVAVGTPVDIVP